MTSTPINRRVLHQTGVDRWLFLALGAFALAVSIVVGAVPAILLSVLGCIFGIAESRLSTTVDEVGLTVRGYVATTYIPWGEVAGFVIRGSVLFVVTQSKTFVAVRGAEVPSVRRRATRDQRLLAVLSAIKEFQPPTSGPSLE